jgi:hypothetical protein
VQLSVNVGVSASADAIPAASEHSRVASRSPAASVTAGAVLSSTVIVWVYGRLVFPQPSDAVQILTLTYALAQVGSAVVMSLVSATIIDAGAVQLSVNVGVSASAVVRPVASVHSRVLSRAPAALLATGRMLSSTTMF